MGSSPPIMPFMMTDIQSKTKKLIVPDIAVSIPRKNQNFKQAYNWCGCIESKTWSRILTHPCRIVVGHGWQASAQNTHYIRVDNQACRETSYMPMVRGKTWCSNDM
jgi:hypothetical protein